MHKIQIFLLASIIATAGARSDNAHAATTDLEEIVVVATRRDSTIRDVARSVSAVDRERIQRATQQLGIDESLSGVPGLYMQNRYNFSQDLRISLRGFGARSSFGIRGIRIYVDDIPETLPDGQGQVDSIDIGSAERIEVLRGPASALYGNAAGGVINVRSELGADEPFIEARLAAGEFDFRKAQLKLGGSGERLDYLLNMSSQSLDGYRDHARSESDLVNGKLGWSINENNRLIVSANYIDQPLAKDPGGINAAQAVIAPSSARDANVAFDAGEALSQSRLGLVYRYSGDKSELLLRNYYVWRDFSNLLPFTSGGAVEIERFFYGAGAQYDRSFLANDALSMTVGFDIDRQQDDRQRFDNNAGIAGALVFDQDEDVSSDGIYLHANYQLAENWQVTAGVRRDQISYDVSDNFIDNGDDSGRLDFDETSVSAGLTFQQGAGTWFAAYATSFETPTTTELANPDGGGGFNDALQAQTAANLELGYRRAMNAFSWDLALFNIELEDELVPFELPAFPGRTFYENAGKSSRFGVEAAIRWQNDSGVSAELSYTYSDFKFDEFVDDDGNDFSGNRLPGLPRHFGYANVSLGSDDGFFGLLEASYSGSLFANNANLVEVDSYIVSNLRFGWRGRMGRWLIEPFAGINNIMDEAYNSNIRINAFGARYYEPAPVRHYYGGIVIRFE